MSRHRTVRTMMAVLTGAAMTVSAQALARGRGDAPAGTSAADGTPAGAAKQAAAAAPVDGTPTPQAVVRVRGSAPRAVRRTAEDATPKASPSEVVVPAKQGRRSMLVAVPVAIGGGTAAAVLLGKGSTANVSGIGIAPEPARVTGLAAVTEYRFTAEGVDVRGDAPAYSWDFGDGSIGAGVSATHVFARAGSYTVKLTVRVGGQEATASQALTVADLTGTWTWRYVEDEGPWATYRMSQDGATVTGTDEVPPPNGGTYPFTGTLSRERNLRLVLDASPQCVELGFVSDDARRISGILDCSGYADYPFGGAYEMVRQ